MSAIAELQERIRDAGSRSTPLRIVGSGSKDFYGGAVRGEALHTSSLNGIVDYEPAELVLTVQAGTSLTEVEATLASRGQMLAFEPPRFGGRGTIGGAVAAGLSGPRRAYAGAARDFVLGVRVIDGRGRALRFGGQVIKNVAGFDVSRLFAGSLGTLGVLTEITLKTLPLPQYELTLVQEADAAAAIRTCNEWAGQPLPISATCHHDSCLYVRLSGAEPAVRAARERIGGELLDDADAFWDAVRDQRHAFFDTVQLWRITVPATTPPLDILSPQLLEWGGALRWVAGEIPAATRAQMAAAGGHLTCFRDTPRNDAPFQPLPAPLLELHRRLKHAFDPHAIFNPLRMGEL
jgi:glycolate oxidase FAD binding subunit